MTDRENDRGRPPVSALRWANEGLAFVLELAALGALGYAGFALGDGALASVAFGLGAPVAAAVAWGLFAAPRARFSVPLAGVLAVKALVFGAATLALVVTGHPALATGFAVVVALNTTFLTLDRRTAPR